MTVGKSPHRKEGKAGSAEEDRRGSRWKQPMPSYKEVRELDRRNMGRVGEPAAFSAMEQVGGSRPLVGSRVKEAIERREEREEREGG